MPPTVYAPRPPAASVQLDVGTVTVARTTPGWLPLAAMESRKMGSAVPLATVRASTPPPPRRRTSTLDAANALICGVAVPVAVRDADAVCVRDAVSDAVWLAVTVAEVDGVSVDDDVPVAAGVTVDEYDELNVGDDVEPCVCDCEDVAVLEGVLDGELDGEFV